jgi:NAD(P)-dependent dehydrogenase (short-subunit alcohol dehydrogenase family)
MAADSGSMAGQVVLITGAASGIGAAGAQELHRRGATVVLVDCDRDNLAQTAASIGSDVLTAVADVTLMQQCQDAVDATLARHGRLDVVWANAGMASFGPLAHTDPTAWKRCIDVNVMGVFNTVRAALPAVMAQHGYIAVTASVSSFAHPPLMSAYAASKAAVEAMCNAWRIELASHGVAVGAIHAHWVTTPLVTEGALHPAFGRLRKTMPSMLNRETPAADAAVMIADGIAGRRRRIWVPGWVRALHALRALLHTPVAERELLRAAPEMEALYLQGMAAEGVLASSFGPREMARERARSIGQGVIALDSGTSSGQAPVQGKP